MGKLTTFTTIMGGLFVLFWMAGLLDTTSVGMLMNWLLTPTSISDLATGEGLIGTLTISIGILGVALSAAFRNDLLLFFSLALVMFQFAIDFFRVYQLISESSVIGGYVAIILLGPIIVAYIITVFEWWRGIDT